MNQQRTLSSWQRLVQRRARLPIIGPQRLIDKAFYMGKFEVTQEQWREVMGDNPSQVSKVTICLLRGLCGMMFRNS
jgi:hypothetical protein